VISIWLVEVKINGNIPIELLSITIKNIGKNNETTKWEFIIIFGSNSLLILIEIRLFDLNK